MLKWYLDKDRNMLKFLIPCLTEYKIYTVENWNAYPLYILIQAKPFIVSTNLSMLLLFHKTFLGPLHDMSSYYWVP